MVTSFGQVCDIVTQSYPLHLTIEPRCRLVRFTMPFIALPGGSNVVIFGQKTLKEKRGIDVMVQFKASVLKAQGHEDGPEMEITAGGVAELNAGAVLRAAMAATVFGQGDDTPSDVDDDVALTLLSQRPMMFPVSEVEMQDRVSTLETAVDDAVNHGLRLECVKMLHDIVLITHLYVQRQASLGDPSARGGYDCAASARCKGRADEVTCFSACQGGYAATTHGQRGNSRNCSRNPQAMYGSVTKAIPKGSTPYRMVTDYRAVNYKIEPTAMRISNLEEKASLFADATVRCSMDMLQG